MSACPFPGGSWRQVMQDRISLHIADQVKVLIFIYDGYEVLLYIPAVAQEDDILPPMKLRHPMGWLQLSSHICFPNSF